MTKFIDCTGGEKGKKTVFTHILHTDHGWTEASSFPEVYDEVYYMGKCTIDGDMFFVKEDGTIEIFKGTKGVEFD